MSLMRYKNVIHLRNAIFIIQLTNGHDVMSLLHLTYVFDMNVTKINSKNPFIRSVPGDDQGIVLPYKGR